MSAKSFVDILKEYEEEPVAKFNQNHGADGKFSSNGTTGGSNCGDSKLSESIGEIEDIINQGDYDVYGIRVDDGIKYNVGDKAHNSHQIFEDSQEDEDGNLLYPEGEGIYSGYYDAGELNGTCTLEITSNNAKSVINNLKQYYGDTVHLLAGNYAEGGNDPGEIVIENAKVIARFEKSAGGTMNETRTAKSFNEALEEVEKEDVQEQARKSDAFTIYKADDDKRLVFGWASVAIRSDGEQVEDRQHDVVDPDELESAAYDYVLEFRDGGEEHNPALRKKAKLVESCVFTKEKQEAIGIPEGIIPEGWWIGFKVEDDDAWEKVKNGTYNMFSIEGRGVREEIEEGDEDDA